MKILLADLETRSFVDLPSAGHRRYSIDPSTSITTAAWKWKGQPNSLRGAIFVRGFTNLTETLPFDFILALEECDRVVFHNAAFDVSVIRGTLHYEIPLHKIDCTMARAQRMSLPGGLDALCETLGVPGKSPGGTALVMRTCKPQRNGQFFEDADTFRDLLAYNLQDVRCLESVDALLPDLPTAERVIWERTWRKNERGLPIDVKLAEAVARRREQIELEVAGRLRQATGGAVTAVTQRARIQKWLETVGVPMRDMRKETVEEALESEDLPFDAYDVLSICVESGGMAPTKAQSLLDRHVDGRYKDGTRYFGARSGRGTSEGVNAFNIARPSGNYNVEQVIDDLLTGCGNDLGNVALTDALRGMICAPPGKMLIDADLSNIELRLSLWLAGDEARLKILREGGDLYMMNAIDGLGLPSTATKKTHPNERFAFKTITLGCGYSLGHKKFFAVNRRKIPGLTLEKAEAWIAGYRRANPLLAGRGGLWSQLDNAAREAYWRPGMEFSAADGKITFRHICTLGARSLFDAGILWLTLPSGRRVPHYRPEIDRDTGEMTFYRAKFGKMLPQKAYGGAWLEIACQSLARDCITAVEATIEAELPDVDIDLDVYDSVICEAPEAVAEYYKEWIEAIMALPMSWAPGLPLRGEGYVARRMKK
jgi:DNA polymerase